MASRGRVPNNSTSISLHERFSKLRSAAGGQKLSGKLQGARAFAEQLQKTARQNSRLTQQMEKRNAALSAALKIKKKSIKQRLGVSNKTTLAVGSKGRLNVALKQKKLALAKSPARLNVKNTKKTITAPSTTKTVRGRGAGRILSQTFTRGGSQNSPKAGRGRGNKQMVTTNTSNRGQTKSPRGRGRGTGRGTGRGAQVQKTSPNKVNRNQNQRGRGQQQNVRGQSNNQANNQRGRGQGRGRGRGQRGRGRGGQVGSKLSREDLDKQLDQYMSKTRHALDQDLEKYMSKMAGGDVDMS